MEITIDQPQRDIPVSILALHGELDGSNFKSLIENATEVYQSGVRYLILDLSELNFLSSAGLVAIHSIALLFRGETPPDPESGWEAFHAIGRDLDSGVQRHVKLINPGPRVFTTFQKTGFDRYFEIHTDRQTAVDSFNL